MNIVLSVYTAKAYKEYILPNINNSNYSIVLAKDVYGLSEDTSIYFDVIENRWRILSDNNYGIRINDKILKSAEITDGQRFEIIGKDGELLYVNVVFEKSDFISTQKYFISKNGATIGSGAENDIIFKASFVSHVHAVIARKNGAWCIEDMSQNGIYVNAKRVKVSTQLKYGDLINIIGLKIIYLNEIIAVCNGENSAVIVNDDRLKPASLTDGADNSGEKQTDGVTHEFFNRAPRIMRKLRTDPIEIEAPPAPKQEESRSLLATIGPSFTMALPMLLGCLLMIYSSRSNGGSSNAFMFTGLITAGSSALLGIFWGAVNYRNSSKKGAKDEKHRFEAYSNYLMRMAEEVKELNRYNSEVMNELYPPADECASITRKNPMLWNRNIQHEDFLTHRVGIGDMPFQADIQIPKEKFTLIDDSLAGKPKLIKDTYSTMKDVPVCIDFDKNRLIGIVGGKGKVGAYEIMKNISAQVAASNCYTDVKLAYLLGGGSCSDAISFAKWFPHCWSDDKKTRYCAINSKESSDICYELTKVFRMRDEASKESYSTKVVRPKPHFILFVSDISILEGEPLAKYIFEKKEEYGLTTVLFAENYEDLPNSCECIVYNDGTYTGVYTPTTLSDLGKQVTYDFVSDERIEKMARTLSKIQVSEVVTGGEIPSSLNFLEMYGVNKVEELNVIERWKKNRTYENMKALIGQRAGGVNCYLDIHEKYHGPHGLVAGTTGSGKSETLQTYILSLAINYSPDDVGFLLVDFKGGGMANLFTDLPHTVGQISNLSGGQIRRSMISIKSENLRRQRVLGEHGVNNINAYTRLFKNNEATVPMPHLFIIIDEFAEMKREEPEFMSELISVAQVGRSLGVHLILATQKPGGVVDDNIRSNSKFKLCLRVQDKQDSSEMLGKPDAAYLSQAGRCYLQVGNDEIFELFQSGWSGATYDESGGKGHQNLVKLIDCSGKTTLLGNKTAQKFKETIKRNWLHGFADCIFAAADECNIDVSSVGYDYSGINKLAEKTFVLLEQTEMGFPQSSYNEKALKNFIELLASSEGKVDKAIEQAHAKGMILPEPKEKTQLDAVIDHISDVFDKYGYHKAPGLWLPMLPENLYIESIESFRRWDESSASWSKSANWSLCAPVGMCDDPENQAQFPLHVDFAESGHLAVCGNVTSGKSTFLQTLIYSMVNTYSPEQLNVYILDFSNHLLQSFESYPHVGAVMYENDLEKIDKFFYLLSQMLAERKKAIGGGNFGQYINVNGTVFPSVLVVFDNYSNFREKTDDKYERYIWELSRDGASFGIFLAFSAGGFGSVEIQNKIGENIRNVIALDLGEKMKYSEVLRINHLDLIPSGNIKGRGIVPYAGMVLEFQTALAVEADDDYARAESIKTLGKLMSKSYNGISAKQIPEIPEKPIWTDISVNEEFVKLIKDQRYLPFAYVKENASIYSIDLRETFCYLIQGKSRSGRSDLMKVIAASAHQKGAEICFFDSGDSQMEKFASKIGAEYCVSPQEIFKYCQKFTGVFKSRNKIKREMLDSGAEEDEVFERMCEEKPIFVFVTSFSAFLKTVYSAQEDCGLMNGFFENILEKGRLHNIYFVFDLNMEESTSLLGKKIYNLVAGYKTGVQLGGLPGQRVFDSSLLPFAEQNKGYRPGVGFAFGFAHADKIIIPFSKGI